MLTYDAGIRVAHHRLASGPAIHSSERPGGFKSDFWTGLTEFSCNTAAMRGYGQLCPIAIASKIFAERWTPLVVRELFCGSHRFNELVIGLPRIPRSLLVQRLRSLETAGVVERRVDNAGRGVEYRLTPAGVELGDVVLWLGDWGKRWANTPGWCWSVRRPRSVGPTPALRLTFWCRLTLFPCTVSGWVNFRSLRRYARG